MQFKTLFPAALAVAAASAQSDNSTAGNLTSVLSSNSNLSSLSTLLSAYPSFVESLGNRTNLTVFAPSNAALTTFNSSGALGDASSVARNIQAVLSYHVLEGMLFYADNITTTPHFPHTGLNTSTYTEVTGGQVIEARLNGMTPEIISGMKNVANITQANINYTGGVVHIIDNVFTIPSNFSATAAAANLTACLGAVNATNLTSTIDEASDITIFAPSNFAFQDIASGLSNLTVAELKNITEYHVLNGSVLYSSMLSNSSQRTLSGGNLTVVYNNGTIFVNSARVINADILISGGVMHIIDSVLNPNDTTAKANETEGAVAATAFSGASSESTVPYTSGQPTATTTIAALITTTDQVAASYTPSASGSAAAASGSKSSSTKKSKGAAAPTGAVGAAALFGGAAFLANI